MERTEQGHRYGLHRVMDKKPCLPQAAERLDSSLPIFSNEILIRVERLNIDAASFVQMEEETSNSLEKIAEIVRENTVRRGKQQNRITGSGGMLIGTVQQVGSSYRGPCRLKEGDRVATVVSLTLTPLHLEEVRKVFPKTHQIEAAGHAILFENSLAVPLPTDFPEPVSMAVFDVAGAPALTHHLASAGNTVVVIGAGGKAGILSCLAARKKVGKGGGVIAIEPSTAACRDLRRLQICDAILSIDASNPVAVESGVETATRGKMGNVVINVASVPGTEISSILASSQKGKVVFFSMATSFTTVALGAEGLLNRSTLLFGNGYFPGHCEMAIDLLRNSKAAHALFLKRYV